MDRAMNSGVTLSPSQKQHKTEISIMGAAHN